MTQGRFTQTGSFPVPPVCPFPSTTSNVPEPLKPLEWDRSREVSLFCYFSFSLPPAAPKRGGQWTDRSVYYHTLPKIRILKSKLNNKSGLTGVCGGLLFLAHGILQSLPATTFIEGKEHYHYFHVM